MHILDRFMEFLVAGIFLCIGIAKIFSYRRQPKAPGVSGGHRSFGLPYPAAAAMGVFEIAAALILMFTPFGTLRGADLVQATAVLLALLTIGAGIYHLRRREALAPSIALFLLAVFVMIGRT
jgi:DoxX-like family